MYGKISVSTHSLSDKISLIRLSVNVARKLYPYAGIPTGNKLFDNTDFVYPVRYDTSKATRLLGLTTYRTQEELVRDSIETFKEKGWWGEK